MAEKSTPTAEEPEENKIEEETGKHSSLNLPVYCPIIFRFLYGEMRDER